MAYTTVKGSPPVVVIDTGAGEPDAPQTVPPPDIVAVGVGLMLMVVVPTPPHEPVVV